MLDRFNKRLFHITYSRINEKNEWLMDELLPPVMRQSRRFIDHVLQVTTIPIDTSERSLWRALKANDAGRLPLQQNTSNVSTYQIQTIELNRHLTSRRSQPALALAVPLSRFTSPVAGGSAFFVRPLTL